MDHKTEQVDDYVKPKIADFGSIRDITAENGADFVDTPIGTPAPGIDSGSTP